MHSLRSSLNFDNDPPGKYTLDDKWCMQEISKMCRQMIPASFVMNPTLTFEQYWKNWNLLVISADQVFAPRYSIMVMDKLVERYTSNKNKNGKRRVSSSISSGSSADPQAGPLPLVSRIVDNNTLKRAYETFRYKHFLDKANMYKSGAAAYGIYACLNSCYLL
jgi:hypothetical protein